MQSDSQIQTPFDLMLTQASTIAYYTLLEALRNRLIWLFGLIIVAGVGVSAFLSELAIMESRQIQVALLAVLLRISAVFLIATFVVTSLVREFNDKGLELVLALPLPRAGYALGKLFGFAALSLVPALLFGGLMAFFTSPLQAGLWTMSLVAELWIVAAFSLLCVLTFSQVMAALSAVIAFYLLARSLTALQLIGNSPFAPDTLSQRVISFVVETIGLFLPHLDQFTRTEWLTYDVGDWNALGPLLIQTGIFLLLITSAAVFDLYRKNQ